MLGRLRLQHPNQENRDRGMADDPLGHAAQQPGDLAGAMRGHDDEIYLVLDGIINNLLGRGALLIDPGGL